LFKRHLENDGRHYSSLVDSSRDLWVDGYKTSAPGRKVSVYTKGALVSLMLDLTIRKYTGHRKSLDHVMRLLWYEFGKNSRGYSLKDFQDLCEQETGQPLELFFKNFVFGTVPIEATMSSLLENVGCKLRSVPSRQLSKKFFGFRTAKQADEIIVMQIAPESPAYCKLCIGDSIVGINAKKPKHKLNSLIDNGHSVKLEVRRRKSNKKLFY